MTPQEHKERLQRAADFHVAQALTKILDTTAFDLHDPAQHSALKELRALRSKYLNRSSQSLIRAHLR